MAKRYDPEGIDAYMAIREEGGYVDFADYAALRTKLQQAEDNRDLYFDDLSITKTTLHLAEKALAAKEAELVELQQCRDHWKISYEELRQWKESAMTVLSKIDLQEIGKEIGARLGCDISPEILPWIVNAKAKLALYRRAVEPVREYWKRYFGSFPKEMVEAMIVLDSDKVINDCIRILDSGREEK